MRRIDDGGQEDNAALGTIALGPGENEFEVRAGVGELFQDGGSGTRTIGDIAAPDLDLVHPECHEELPVRRGPALASAGLGKVQRTMV